MTKINKVSFLVAWYLTPHAKRPFAYSTKATSDLIAVLMQELGDIRAVRNAINYDDDAKAICDEYIKWGIYQPNIW